MSPTLGICMHITFPVISGSYSTFYPNKGSFLNWIVFLCLLLIFLFLDIDWFVVIRGQLEVVLIILLL